MAQKSKKDLAGIGMSSHETEKQIPWRLLARENTASQKI